MIYHQTKAMKQKKYLLWPLLLLFIGMQMACLKKPEDNVTPSEDSQPLLTILKNNYSFSMIYSALQRTGLDKTLEGKGPYTLIAPDNDAFSRSGINADSLAGMDTATLKKLVSYHIIPVSIPYSSIPQTVDFAYPTLAGIPAYFSEPIPGPNQYQYLTSQKLLHINGIKVDNSDIAASNGYIIVPDMVLNYPAASVKAFLEQNARFSVFVQALKQFGLFDQLDKPGPFVIMAPTNDAFANYGLDKNSITQIDTIQYKKFLFSNYVTTPKRFFISDLLDAPLALTDPPGIVTKDCVKIFSTASYGVYSLNFKFIQSYYFLPPYYGDAYVYAPPANVTDPDHPALNGVIHGIDALVIPPDSVRTH